MLYCSPCQLPESMCSILLLTMGALSISCIPKLWSKWLQPHNKKLQGFTSKAIDTRGQIALIIELGNILYLRWIIADFMIVDLHPVTNAILERPILHELKALTSIYHYMKSPIPSRVGVVQDEVESHQMCIWSKL